MATASRVDIDTLIAYLCPMDATDDTENLIAILSKKKKTELGNIIGDRMTPSAIHRKNKNDLIEFIIDQKLF
jgi:hypothetical protein